MNDHLPHGSGPDGSGPDGSGPIDRELGRRLRGLAPRDDDTTAVFHALAPRLEVARRRRRAAIAGASAFSLMLLVGSAAALIGDNPFARDVDTLPPAERGSQVPGTLDDDATTTSSGSTDGTTATSSHGGSTPTSDGSTPGTTTDTTDTTGTTDTTDTSGTSGTSGTTGTTTTPVSITKTCVSDGGTVKVQWDGTTMVLVSAEPNAGYAITDQQVDADRVRIEFLDAAEEGWRVEARGGTGSVACRIDPR